MKETGWFNKPNVHIIQDKWQNVISKLPTFDGVYFDTWDDTYVYETLIPLIPKILNDNGIFSLFGYFYDDNYKEAQKMFTQLGMEVTHVDIKIKNIPNKEKQGLIYWNKTIDKYTQTRRSLP